MLPKMFDLSGRIVLITGSTKGIGRAMADQFVEHGADVVVTGRNPAECKEVAASINDTAGREAAWHYSFDFSKPDEIKAVVDATLEHWGRLDTVVGNAYVTAIGTELEIDPDVFADVLRVNVVHNALLARYAFPALKQSGDGCIVFLGSASGLAPSPSVAAYGISKRALMHMMQDLAVEWGKYKIRVNAVIPGLTRTPAAMAYLGDEESLKARTASWPIQRIGEPEEIASAAIYLCSPGAGYTTGCTIISDGGRTLLTGNVIS